jgi:hypothetical protein
VRGPHRLPAVPTLVLLAATVAGPAAADCPPTRGDLSPGELVTGVTPPAWRVAGDGLVTVADVVVLLRAAVGLQALAWVAPGPTCAPLPGDYAPGRIDDSTTPPTWRPEPDGLVNVADGVTLLRAAVRLHDLGVGVDECAHSIDLDWAGPAPRQETDRRCPVGLSSDLELTVVALDALNEEAFVVDRYTVTYVNVSRGGASEPGVDVPQPIDALLFLDPGQPTYSEVERLSILDEAAKVLPPLSQDVFFNQGTVAFDATITVFGHPVDRPGATCVGSLGHRFLVSDSGPGTDPATDPGCLAEQAAETP